MHPPTPPKSGGLELRGAGVVAFVDQCDLSPQNIRPWGSGDSCCSWKRQFSTSWACAESLSFVLLDPRGRVGRAS